ASLHLEELKSICQAFPIILSIPFQPEHLIHMDQYLDYQGLNVQGGEEEKVGFKSFDDLDMILEQLELSD
ncbi:MAG: hypothetical protein AAF738_08335, partial [Bacteroidota bacterium]